MKAIVLLSGGMDSAVCLWWAKKKGWSVRALSFDYGQRHKKELQHAKRLARLAHVPIDVVQFSLPWSGSTLTSKKRRLPKSRSLKNMSRGIPSTYVPGRNTLFLSFALSLADQAKAKALVIGANAIDYSGYPDCRPQFIKAFEKVAHKGTKMGAGRNKISIHAPLIRLSKSEIVKLGRKLGTPLHLTWSCYQGNNKPCEKCDSCRLREKGYKEASLN